MSTAAATSTAITLQGAKIQDLLHSAEVVIWKDGNREKVRFVSLLSSSESNKNIDCIVTMPGAFTPTCGHIHAPSFFENGEALNALGAKIFIVARDTIDVLEAWKGSLLKIWEVKHDPEGKKSAAEYPQITMISDCFDSFGTSSGLLMKNHPTLNAVLKRSVLLAQNGLIAEYHVNENAKECTVTHGSSILERLKNLKIAGKI